MDVKGMRFQLNDSTNQLPYVDTSSNNCICHRSERTIQCTGCGFITKGRVARQCKYHPLVIYLLDFKSCPFCDAPAESIKEYITNGNDLNNNFMEY